MPKMGDQSQSNKDLLEDSTYGLEAIEALIDDLETRLTAQRASNLDNLDVKLSDFWDQWASLVYDSFPAQANMTDITAGSPAHTLGSWVEFIAANAVTVAFWITSVVWGRSGGINAFSRVQVGKGGAGSESVIWEGVADLNQPRFPYPLPIPIPVAANTRIAMRTSSLNAGTVVRMSLQIAKGL